MHRFLVFVILFYFKGVCQDADTLLPHILSIQNDTERVNQLYKTGFELRNKNPRLSYIFAAETEAAALKIKSPKHLAKSYNLLGVLFYKKGSYNVSLNYHNKALALRTAAGDILGMAVSELNLGNVYSDLLLYSKAEKSYLNALNGYKQLGTVKKIVDCLNNLGTLKHYLKEYDAAIENYLLALKQVPENDYESKAMCLNNLGEAYLLKNDLEKAEAFNQDALEIRLLSDNRFDAGDSYLNLAGIFVKKKEYENAKVYLDSAYSIGTRYQYFDLLMHTARAYSIYFEEMKNFESAYNWMKKYDGMKNQLQLEQRAQARLFDFDESKINDHKKIPANKINNLWLLILVGLFTVSIPFIIIQYKR